MEKVIELVDTMMKAQKEFLDGWVNSQRQFMENWTEATKIMQGSLLNMEGPQENAAKEMLNLYKSALTTMVDSSKVLADEAGKLQVTWKNTVEKQMEMSRDMVKNFSGFFKKAA
ncbi:MAG TPA: hypothetical protein VF905_08965 [Nitrospirota bacterium]|nr:hypothetical protein [Nitrospirota bacterium]